MVVELHSTEKGIKITDSNGKDLMRVLPQDVKSKIKEQKRLQFKQSYDDLRRKIDAHDVISFDIFDTLITRRVYEPEMVFDLVGRYATQNGICINDFRRERIKAQLESGLNNANLDEIYEQLAINTGISIEQAHLLKKEELCCEKRVVVPREDMKELFNYALEAQKKVYLTTDMYLNRRYIVSLLNVCGISGYYDILDSCEYRKLKLEGLFDELKVINPGMSILHIGDNYINDCICAEIVGIDSFLIPKGIDVAKKEKANLPETSDSVSDGIVKGSLISQIYNSPFGFKNANTKRKLSGMEIAEEKWFNIGYVYLGPIILSFAGWMVNSIPLDKYNGILLAARDGYLLNEIFSILKLRGIIPEKIKIEYFYVSRKAAVAMRTDEEAIIDMLIKQTAPFYLPDTMLRDVFCMPEGMVETYDIDVYGEERYRYVWDHYDDIKRNVQRLKRNFYRYLGKKEATAGGKYLLYDFVSSGTVHRALEDIVPFELDGVYYQFTGENDLQGEIYSRYDRKNQVINDCYKTMESMMLSLEPSVWSYDDKGEPIFCSEERSPQLLNITKLVHQGVIAFATDFLVGFELQDSIISDQYTLKLVQEMNEHMRSDGIENDLFDDWFMGGIG